MGKRILGQRKGKGGSQFRAPVKGRLARYPAASLFKMVKGSVVELIHEGVRSAPLAKVRFEDGQIKYMPAVTGTVVGSTVELGSDVAPKLGNVLPLARIPEGTPICNIELSFGDGGKLVRSSGASATLFSQTPAGSVVKLPSGKTVTLEGKCRATIGEVSGGGRVEKPFLKAGARYYAMRAKGKVYPRVRGIAMAAPFHPFGGAYKKKKQKAVSRHAPPGRKVGSIAPRKTGRKRIARWRVGA